MVWRLHSCIRCSFNLVFTPSVPNGDPSGHTTAGRPPGLNKRMIRARNRSAVSRVRNWVGKLFSIPASSWPPKGGLPNARPIAFSDSPRCQRSQSSVFSDAVKNPVCAAVKREAEKDWGKRTGEPLHHLESKLLYLLD